MTKKYEWTGMEKMDKKGKVGEFFYKLSCIPYRIKDKWHNLYYGLKNRKHIIKTNLPMMSWYDTDIRMLYGMMNLLVEYIDNEKPFECLDWEWDENHRHVKDELLTIRRWWDNYENRQKQIEDTCSSWFEETDEVKRHCKLEYLTYLEDQLEKEETEMMKKLVEIRGYMWV